MALASALTVLRMPNSRVEREPPETCAGSGQRRAVRVLGRIPVLSIPIRPSNGLRFAYRSGPILDLTTAGGFNRAWDQRGREGEDQD